MPFGVKEWVGAAVVGGILIASWALPPRDEGFFFRLVYTPREESVEATAFRRVLREVQEANFVHQRLLWRDSLASLARAAQEDGPGWAVALPPQSPDLFRHRFGTAIETQLLSLGLSRPRVAVGTALMDVSLGTHPGYPGVWYGDTGEIMASTGPLDPFCFRVDAILPRQGDSLALERRWGRSLGFPQDPSAAVPNPLGGCALHAAFGSPGPQVAEWLWGGAYRFGLEAEAEPVWRFTAPGGGAGGGIRGLFGRRDGTVGFWDLSLSAEACLQGKAEGCRRALFGELEDGAYPPFSYRARADDGSPLSVAVLGGYYNQVFAGAERSLLWELSGEFGAERFERFWSSGLPVEAAFEAAFGEPMAAWAVRWSQDRIRPLADASAIPLGDAVLTLLTLGILAGVAVAVHGRRG